MEPITEEALIEKLSNEVEGKLLNYERISSKYKKKPYEIKGELDGKYLEKVKEIMVDQETQKGPVWGVNKRRFQGCMGMTRTD